MDTNELELKPTEMAEEQNPERRNLWLSLYILLAAATLALNIIMLRVVIDGYSELFNIVGDFFDFMIPWLNLLYYSAFEWLGKRLKFNLFVPFITTVLVCSVSVALSYLTVVA